MWETSASFEGVLNEYQFIPEHIPLDYTTCVQEQDDTTVCGIVNSTAPGRSGITLANSSSIEPLVSIQNLTSVRGQLAPVPTDTS